MINPDMSKCLQIAQSFEFRSITEAQNKEQYVERMGMKYDEIFEKRKQNSQMGMMNGVPMMQNNPGMQNGGMGNMNMAGNGMQNGGMGNMNNMNNIGFPNGMGGQAGQMNGAPGQNPMFPAQLQRPMQPSPLPMQQQQQQQPTTMNPAALHMSQQQQVQQQQQQQVQQQQAAQQAQRMQNMNQAGQGQAPNMQGGQSQSIPPEIMAMAKSMFTQMPEEQRNGIRQKMMATMTEQQRMALAQGGRGDPLLQFLARRAMEQMRKRGPNAGAQSNPNMQTGNNNMSVPMGNPQRPASQADSQNIDFSSILGQQANALKLQESGEQVVPASNNNNNNSNNQSGMNQMNMPQGINPQMLANGGQGMTQSQMQYLYSQQKEAQQREAMQKHLMANRQGMPQRQQNGQLHGQPGGLHTPNVLGAPGQNNSPAMSMLNRPLAPPGQATPGTPQPNRQQPVPATPMNGASQLAQHHQNMLQNNQQQQQQMNQAPAGQMHPQMNPQLMAMLNKVPPAIREKLLTMPTDQAQEFLIRYRATLSRQQGQPNMPGNMPNMGAPQQPPQQGNNMMQQHMANAMPGFTQQSNQNQQGMPMDPTAQMQNRIAQQHENKIKQQAMDIMVFPKAVLTQLGIAVPPQVQRWGDLKVHLQQNMGNVPPGSQEKVSQLQSHWFQRPGEFQLAMQNLMTQRQNAQQMQRQMQAGQIPNDGPQQAAAPPAQMVPPAPMMQGSTQGPQAAGNANQPRPQANVPVTPQDIQLYRSKQPQSATWDDQTVRQVIMRGRQQAQARQANVQAQAQAQAQAQQKQAAAQAAQTAQMSRPQNQAGQNQPQRGQPPKQHLPANDDVIEISSQAAKQSAPQAPAMQASASQSQLPRLSQEQLAKMSPVERDAYVQKMQRAQQQQMQSLRNAQGQLTAPGGGAGAGGAGGQGLPQPGMPPKLTAEQSSRLQQMYKEVLQANPKGKPVTCDAAGLEKARGILKKVWTPLQRIASTFPLAIYLRYTDERIREVFRWQIVVLQNAKDAEGNIKDFLAVPPDHLQKMEQGLAAYMMELKGRQKQLQTAAMAQQQKQQQLQQPGQGQASNAAASATSQPGHVRKASANVKAPPAPTDNKTFDWAAPSPHGIPKYDNGRNELTPDKLKFPPNKKRKTGQSDSQASTPASPPVGQGKPPSSDAARKGQQQKSEREVEVQKFRCNDLTCDASVRGFESEDQLKQHTQTQHQPIEDPLAFLLESATSAMGDDKSAVMIDTKQPARKQDVTKQEQQSSGKTGKAAAKVDDSEETLWESLAEKIGMPAIMPEPQFPSAGMVDPDMIPFWDGGLFQYNNNNNNNGWPSEEDLDASTKEVMDVMDWQYKYCDLVDPTTDRWELRPGVLDPESSSSPELTPASSESSNSSHASDVSQSDALNFMLAVENFDEEGGVPVSMIPVYHQLKGMLSDDGVGGEEKDQGGEVDGEEVSKRKRIQQDEANLLIKDFWAGYY